MRTHKLRGTWGKGVPFLKYQEDQWAQGLKDGFLAPVSPPHGASGPCMDWSGSTLLSRPEFGPHSLEASGRDPVMERVTEAGLEARAPTANLNAGQELFVSYLIRTELNWFPKSHNAIRGCHKRTKIKTKTSSGAPYVIFSMLKSVKRQIEGKTKSKNTTKHCQAFREKAGEIFPKGGMPLESIWQAVCTWRDKGNELMAFLFFN